MAVNVSRSCLLCLKFNNYNNVIFPRLNQCLKTRCQITTVAARIPKSQHLRFNTCSRQFRYFMTRGGRDQPAKDFNRLTPSEPSQLSQLIKPFGFTVLACSSSFVGAMIWQYETLRHHAKKIMNRVDKHKHHTVDLYRNSGFRSHINSIWNNMSPGKKMICGILACNIGVFFLWRLPTLQPAMMKYFSCSTGTPAISMILSAFSQYSFWHIAANMYVLWSFSSVTLSMFGKEQFMGVYLSGATIASLAGIMNKLARRRVVPSVGASGAIMALLGCVCYAYPDARLSIAFVGDIIPHSFSADNAMKSIILLDVLGVVFGWRFFDHAAHLGGMLFGLWYMHYGKNLIWGNRQHVMKIWHDLRGKP